MVNVGAIPVWSPGFSRLDVSGFECARLIRNYCTFHALPAEAGTPYRECLSGFSIACN